MVFCSVGEFARGGDVEGAAEGADFGEGDPGGLVGGVFEVERVAGFPGVGGAGG